MVSMHLTLLCSLLILSYIVQSDIYSCPRIRKAWHLTTEKEKQLYINGIHRLNDQDKFKHFGSTHHHIVDSAQAHGTAEFFAWHRYFLFEFENQIRRLGPEYECFSVPYWDITTDAGLFENSYIFNSGLGGIGDAENDDCVDISDSGSWSVLSFPLIHICHETKNPKDNPTNGCCLKRASAKMDVSSLSSYTHFIKKYNNFGARHGFREATFAGLHSEAHSFIGGIWANYTHMISRYSSEDPIFYLLHSWFDYLFVVWKQCWGYNKINSNDLQKYPSAYFAWPKEDIINGIPSSELDDKLYFIPMTDITWWESDKFKPTARNTWTEWNNMWNIQYEKGSFIIRSHLSELCDNEWDDNVLLDNSKHTMDIIKKQSVSKIDEYQMKLWDYMFDNIIIKDIYSESDFLQTWQAKTCNYQRQIRAKEPCYIPDEYEKCNDNDYLRKDDLTIDELLNKNGIKNNDCLEEVRINLYSWAKTMGMLYELCMGKFDEYFVCDMPNIDLIIEYDDEKYYNKLIVNKQKMNGMNQMDVIKDNVKIGNYTQFDIMKYLVIAFVIGGCALIAIIGNCKAECDRKVRKDNTDYRVRDSFSYGSMVETS
eukprot:389030_1